MSETVKSQPNNINICKAPLDSEAFLERLQEAGDLYRAARTVSPWFETDLTLKEACNYIASLTQSEGFGAFIADTPEGKMVGARLHELITIDQLENEHGPALKEFVQALTTLNDKVALIWTRDTFISPDYQRKGLATRLGRAAFAHMAHHHKSSVLLCRVRSDNTGSITAVRRVGYEPSGVRRPHSRISGLEHEYWYKQL